MIEVVSMGHPVGQFKPWKWHEGNDYCLRLVTVYVHQNSRRELKATAVYRPLFQIFRSKGSIEIVVRLGKKLIVSYIGKYSYIQVINDSE